MQNKKLKFSKIYYEEDIINFTLTNNIFNDYKDIEKIKIKSHNNIEELRKYDNKDFPKLKNYLILGKRKSFTYRENHKISDFLVPFTSSGCYAMCMYCYLVCNFNKCSYLRIFVNQEEILNKLIKHSNISEKEYVYEIGSNSDLLLENLVTKKLSYNLEYFIKNTSKGKLTFPTKFSFIDPLKNISDKNRIIPRISLNPEKIINSVEFKTSSLIERLNAINLLFDFGYNPYILIAPIIITNDFEKNYKTLFEKMYTTLNKKMHSKITFEIIFMTYSYIHKKINEEAFPNAISLYNKDLMTSRGTGKYHYKDRIKEYGKNYIKNLIDIYFPKSNIRYIV